jgi:hypothetical protein
VAFCETFDNPSVNPATSRAGQLNGVLWGTSMTGDEPGNLLGSVPSACGSGNVNYPGNVEVCDGRLHTTVEDTGNVTSLSMYPRQPFDFAGRTGTITFDVSNDTQGIHGAWPELWVTDQPVPDPFVHTATFYSVPRNGFGIRFAGCTDGNGTPNTCQPDGGNGVGVDSAIVVNNYVAHDYVTVLGDHDVLLSGRGQMNHYQIRVSQNQVVVYGTDPFTGSWNPATNPLIHVATIPNVDLSFTRGLVWLEDVHYNGDKFGSQGLHTFRWDNLGFDGPVLPRDLGFDVPNNNAPVSNINNHGNSGLANAYTIPTNGSLSLTVPDVKGSSIATGALLTFNFFSEAVIPLKVAVNGHDLSIPWPYPDTTVWTSRPIAIPVPLADIVTGNNTVTFSAGNYLFQVMNIDLILQGAGGIIKP